MKKRPDVEWEIIEFEKVNLKHGYSVYPEEHIEIMESSKETNNGNHSETNKRK